MRRKGSAPRFQFRAARAGPLRQPIARLLVLLLMLGSASCSYIFSEIRTVYEYEPSYGVDSPDFRRSLEVLGTELSANNRATLLRNGDETFGALLEAIRGARSSINLELYIFDHGQTGTEFAHAFAERARAGVEVRVLVDGFGSRLGGLEDEMTAAGVRLETYKPLRIYSLDRVGNRTHRRIVTVDGRIGFCGGFAIDDRWRGNARNPSEWRDTNIRVEGPVVAQLQHVFLEDWVHTTGEVIHGGKQFPPIDSQGETLAQAVSSSRNDQSSMAKLQYYMGSRRRARRSGSRTPTSCPT